VLNSEILTSKCAALDFTLEFRTVNFKTELKVIRKRAT